MGSGTFRDGWRVVRARRSEFLDPARLRRRTLLCGLVAAVVGTGTTVVDVLWHVVAGPWPLHVVAVACFAAAVGSLTATFVRIGPSAADVTPTTPSGDWRRQERIARQFAARPPTMLAEDREAVIDHADRAVPVAVVLAERFMWNPVAWAFAWLGLLAVGVADTDRVTLLVGPPVFAVLQSATFISAVTNAGRADAARARAALLPPPEPEDDPRGRHGRDPQGSKLSLPDETV